MSKSFKLIIVTPGNKNIEEDIISITTENDYGKIEFLGDHANTFSSLVPTITTFVKADGTKKEIFTSVGIAFLKDNFIKIACDSADWPEEIDIRRAEESKKRATDRLKSKDVVDRERASRALSRARARLELKNHI